MPLFETENNKYPSFKRKERGGVWILLFSEVTLFEYNVSTILSLIVDNREPIAMTLPSGRRVGIYPGTTHFLLSLHDHDVKMPSLTFYGGRKQTKTNLLPFLNLDIISPTWFEGTREKNLKKCKSFLLKSHVFTAVATLISETWGFGAWWKTSRSVTVIPSRVVLVWRP